VVVWHLAEVGLSLHTKEGRNRVCGVARLGIGRRSVHYCTELGKDKSSMAGGGDGAVSAVAFNFLEVWCKSFNIFLDTTFKWFSGSVVGSCPVSWVT